MSESSLAQTHADFALLLWNDGSTDDSVVIATHYAQRNKRIQVVAATRN
ncbi:glycosyltransferase [Stenomitos frigidus AS-A4]|uniref:Glycosyltransferase n=1 Tax=Stenomitos frigidus AS-A4 TaxID=2933935 RepID=A0ABV0KV48_9CYAN